MNPYPPSSSVSGVSGGGHNMTSGNLMTTMTLAGLPPMRSRNSSESSSDDDIIGPSSNVVMKFSAMVTSTLLKEPFFLDFPVFVKTFEEVYRLNNLMTPGPSALVDFYRLYAGIIEGDKYIHRTIQLLSTLSLSDDSPSRVDAKVDKYVVKARSKLKRYRKLIAFFMENSLEDAINEPFVLSESTLRGILQSLWEKTGQSRVTRKKMEKLYFRYCRHVLDMREFFYGIFKISFLFPHGPYSIGKLEQLLVMIKQIDKPEFQEGSLVFSLALYLREDLGLENEIFMKLPTAARDVISNESLHLVLLSAPSSANNKSSDDGCNYPQLCSIAPASSGDPFRVQFQLPGELQHPDYTQVFCWSFFPLENEPGVFCIRNEQWKEFLILEGTDNPRICRVSTTDNFRSKMCEFSVVLEDNLISIFSNYNNFGLTVDPKTSRCSFIKASRGTPLLTVRPSSME